MPARCSGRASSLSAQNCRENRATRPERSAAYRGEPHTRSIGEVVESPSECEAEWVEARFGARVFDRGVRQVSGDDGSAKSLRERGEHERSRPPMPQQQSHSLHEGRDRSVGSQLSGDQGGTIAVSRLARDPHRRHEAQQRSDRHRPAPLGAESDEKADAPRGEDGRRDAFGMTLTEGERPVP